MVSEAFQNSKLHLKQILETTDVSSVPDSNTYVIPYKPNAREVDIIPPNPCGIGTIGASGVIFCVECEGDIQRVDVREWYLYETSDGNKWFSGETEVKIDVNKAFTVCEANAIGFFAQVITFTGNGTVRVYASGDYVD